MCKSKSIIFKEIEIARINYKHYEYKRAISVGTKTEKEMLTK